VAETQIGLDAAELSRSRALELLHSYPATHALVDERLPLQRHMREAPGWERVAEAGDFELWRLAESAALPPAP
jgi:hypothetical protein